MVCGLGLNPFDPPNSHWFRVLALASYISGQKEQALVAALRALKARPAWLLTLETAAVCHAGLGRLVEARACFEQMRKLPVPKGDPTSIMMTRNPAWAEEIAVRSWARWLVPRWHVLPFGKEGRARRLYPGISDIEALRDIDRPGGMAGGYVPAAGRARVGVERGRGA